jgi:hypothetical protein
MNSATSMNHHSVVLFVLLLVAVSNVLATVLVQEPGE